MTPMKRPLSSSITGKTAATQAMSGTKSSKLGSKSAGKSGGISKKMMDSIIHEIKQKYNNQSIVAMSQQKLHDEIESKLKSAGKRNKPIKAKSSAGVLRSKPPVNSITDIGKNGV